MYVTSNMPADLCHAVIVAALDLEAGHSNTAKTAHHTAIVAVALAASNVSTLARVTPAAGLHQCLPTKLQPPAQLLLTAAVASTVFNTCVGDTSSPLASAPTINAP
jgi:hypothetical protein